MSASSRVALGVMALILACAAACDSTEAVRPATAVTVFNFTADSIAVQLLEREVATRVDPVPERAASEESDRLVLAGGQRAFPTSTIIGYAAGKDLTVFVYRIRDGRSRFTAALQVADAELRAAGFTITVRPSDLAASYRRGAVNQTVASVALERGQRRLPR